MTGPARTSLTTVQKGALLALTDPRIRLAD